MNAASTPSRGAPDKLPNRWEGRHGLSSAEVEEHQRRRLYDAVAVVVSEQGYAGASVQDFLDVAGISRPTFYKYFRNKQDAYLRSFEDITAILMRRIGSAFDHSDDFVTGTNACLREFLTMAAEQPEYAVMCVVEVKAAGSAALERRAGIIQGLADLLRAGAERHLGALEAPPLAAVGAIGGVHEIVYSRIARGETGALPGLLPELSYVLWAPYIGPDAAGRAMDTLRTGF